MIFVPGGSCNYMDSHKGYTTCKVEPFLMDKSEVIVLQFSEFVKQTAYITRLKKMGIV